jgi:outer membrane protein assembly factor BamB
MIRDLIASPVLSAAIAVTATLAASLRADDSWPQFRGPSGQGVASDAALPLTWSETEGVVWKTAIVGRGWSSPAVADGRIWLTTAEEGPSALIDDSTPKLGGVAPTKVTSLNLSAVQVDLATGQVLKTEKLFSIDAPPSIHQLNSYASPSPVIDDGRVICHFGTMGTACLDAATGEKLWETRFEIDHIVGPGSSPVVHDGLAIFTCDGGDKQFIVAINMKTGQEAWRRDRPPIRVENPDLRKAYSTPLLIEFSGREQLIIPGAQWFVSYDPRSGEELWRVDHGDGYSNVPRPVFDGARVYLDTGFNKAQLWAVRVDGSGDVTDTHVDWRERQQMPTMPSPIVTDGLIFVITDGGVATCLDAETGKLVWRERVGGQYSASPLLGARRIYFCSHEGRTTVIEASSDYKVVAENFLEGRHMASPVAIDGDLVLRTDTHLYRITDDGAASTTALR